MKVPLLDLETQYATLRDPIRAAIDRVCDSQRFILGPEVAALEEELAAVCGVRHAIGMSSGTDALLAALMAIGTGPGDEVITTAFSFFATAGVVVRLGARPVFVDVDPETLNLDPDAAIRAITPRTKAILPVHLFGRTAEMDTIVAAAPERGIAVIEDAAQAIGARDVGRRPAGGIGKMGCLSFFPSKNLGGFGDGGMTVTDDDELAERLRILRVHGGRPKYYHRIVGGNFRLDELQAAVLRVKLERLAEWNLARREVAARYRRLLAEAGLGELVRPPLDAPGHVYHQFVVRVPWRDELRGWLTERGVGTAVYYPVPLHLQDCFAELGYRPGDLPHSEEAALECLALPMYPELAEEAQRYVVEETANFLTAEEVRSAG